MKTKRNICIVPYGDKWALRREGHEYPLHVMACQKDAKELAWDVAAREGVRVILADKGTGEPVAFPVPMTLPAVGTFAAP